MTFHRKIHVLLNYYISNKKKCCLLHSTNLITQSGVVAFTIKPRIANDLDESRVYHELLCFSRNNASKSTSSSNNTLATIRGYDWAPTGIAHELGQLDKEEVHII